MSVEWLGVKPGRVSIFCFKNRIKIPLMQVFLKIQFENFCCLGVLDFWVLFRMWDFKKCRFIEESLVTEMFYLHVLGGNLYICIYVYKCTCMHVGGYCLEKIQRILTVLKYSHCFPFFISEKLLIPISKNENKPLQTLPSLAKPAAALQTFNSAILTPVSNNNTGFLRNLLNSSAGKVQQKFCPTSLS